MRALPISITEIHIPDHTELLEAARRAEASHLHLITDGRTTLLSPIVPLGWHKLAVRVKDAP